jgi:phosphoribosylamine--glycine ligase
MNIAIVSNTASFHQIAQLLSKESTVYHYGASSLLNKTDNYFPIPIDIHGVHLQRETGSRNIESEVNDIIEDLSNKNIDFLMANGTLDLSYNQKIQRGLSSLNIPYFFCNKKCANLEYDKFQTKHILNELGIPTGTAIDGQINGQILFDNFFEFKRPFVVKCYQYQYGRQTTIVNDENFEEVYLDLFSKKLESGYRLTNIDDHWDVVLEKFINIKQELSCHYLINATGCKYLGSARDYKKFYDGDKGYNTIGTGAYNVNEIDNRIHEYVDKFFNYLKSHDYQYKGFLFMGIAIDENNIPRVLEINTRGGDPEINVILGSISNNISDLLFAASNDYIIPDIVYNDVKTVSIRLVNSDYNWKEPVTKLPNLSKVPDNILHSLEGGEGRSDFSITHSLLTASADTYENASKEIYNYLSNQDLGQYRYRSDIGILL